MVTSLKFANFQQIYKPMLLFGIWSITSLFNFLIPGSNIQIGITTVIASIYLLLMCFSEKKYSDTDVTSSLAVVFPTEKPKYIIYMVYHNPKGKIRWGGNICSDLLVHFITGIIGYTHLGNEEEYNIETNKINLDTNLQHITNVPFEMPNFIGMTAGDVLNILSKLNIKINVSGNGIIVKQNPPAGETVDKNATIYLQLK